MAEVDFLRDISGRWPVGDHIAFYPFLKWHISRVDDGRDADLISTEKRRIVDFIVRNANSGGIIQERETEADADGLKWLASLLEPNDIDVLDHFATFLK
jgi:hypothetical protein